MGWVGELFRHPPLASNTRRSRTLDDCAIVQLSTVVFRRCFKWPTGFIVCAAAAARLPVASAHSLALFGRVFSGKGCAYCLASATRAATPHSLSLHLSSIYAHAYTILFIFYTRVDDDDGAFPSRCAARSQTPLVRRRVRRAASVRIVKIYIFMFALNTS